MNEDLLELYKYTLNKLTTIWAEIGYCKEDQDIKEREAFAFIKARLKELEDEEERNKKEIIFNINNLGAEVNHLSRCLQEDISKLAETDEDMSMLELQEYLQQKLETFNKEVDRRTKIFSQLKDEELELCNELCEDPSDDDEKAIPSKEDMHYKKQIVETLKSQLVQRRKSFIRLRAVIMSHMDELHRNPSTSFERHIFSESQDIMLSIQNLQDMKIISDKLGLQLTSQRKQKAVLTEEVNLLQDRLEVTSLEKKKFWLSITGFLMDDLALLKDEKERLRLIRQEKMSIFIDKLRMELEILWDKCYTSNEERMAFKAEYTEDYTEEILQQHEDEIVRINKVYERDRHIYERVKKWFVLWKEVTQLEEKANNPNRLFENRGCTLLQEEKQRKRVSKLLPKTESELEKLIKTVETERAEPFLICGMKFNEFIKAQWQNYNSNKLKEKLERQEAKTKQLQLDARIGTGKISVKRSNTTRTPSQTSKYIKTGPNQRTPVRNSSKELSKCSSVGRPSSRLFTLRESNRRNDHAESTFNCSEVSSYLKFSERLQTMSERENIRSSVLLPNRQKRRSPRMAPKGLPRTPIRTGIYTPLVRNARTVPATLGQRRSSRLNVPKTQNTPSFSTTPYRNKLSFLI